MREVKSLDSRQQTADSRCNRLICEIIIFVASLCFLLLFSSSTRPGSPDPIAGDQAMFMTIGKYWAKGVLPYVGLWDSKGPIIFFINALGYLIFGSKTGPILRSKLKGIGKKIEINTFQLLYISLGTIVCIRHMIERKTNMFLTCCRLKRFVPVFKALQ